MTTLIRNGLSAENTSGTQGWQEAQREDNLQQQAYPTSGSTEDCAPKKNRYIYIENSSNVTSPLSIKDVGTVSELLEKIYELFPNANSEAVGLRVSATRMGTMRRTYLTGSLPPDAFFLYVNLYLKKHPAILSR